VHQDRGPGLVDDNVRARVGKDHGARGQGYRPKTAPRAVEDVLHLGCELAIAHLVYALRTHTTLLHLSPGAGVVRRLSLLTLTSRHSQPQNRVTTELGSRNQTPVPSVPNADKSTPWSDTAASRRKDARFAAWCDAREGRLGHE
jgi:hypothetical protein